MASYDATPLRASHTYQDSMRRARGGAMIRLVPEECLCGNEDVVVANVVVIIAGTPNITPA